MTGQGNHVLISYSDDSKDSQAIAHQLAAELRPRMYPETREYSQSRINNQPPCAYDWLILVYSPDARRSAVYQTVENALDLTVKRHMRGVLAITPGPAELPPEWATLRKYDASTPPETIRQAMSYAKTPYTRERMQELGRTSSSALSKSQNKYLSLRSLLVASLATIMTLLGVAAFFLVPLLHPTHPQQATVTISNSATATARVFKSATAGAVASAQASATAPASSMAQQQLDQITNTLPKFTGFQKEEKWDQNPSCKLDPQHATYEATIATPGQYVRCMATATSLKNFAYQVSMNITGDAGGIIFRFDDRTGAFYRFSVRGNGAAPGSDEYGVYQCIAEQKCTTTNGVGDGTPLISDSVQVDSRVPLTLTVIAKDSTIDLYINGKFIYRLAGQQVLSGAIGVYAASVNISTTVTFTNPKVWQL